MTTDAAQGYTRTVRGYLDHEVPVSARDYEGATAAHAAAVGGKVDVLQLLVSRDADLNIVCDYGDSPLAATIRDEADFRDSVPESSRSKRNTAGEGDSACGRDRNRGWRKIALLLRQHERPLPENGVVSN